MEMSRFLTMPGFKTRYRHLNNHPTGLSCYGTDIPPYAKMHMPTGLDGRDSEKEE